MNKQNHTCNPKRKLEVEQMLYPHNKDTFSTILKTLETTNNLCLVQGMGVGKSFLFMALVLTIFEGLRILYVVPKNAVASNLCKYKEFKQIEKQIDFLTFAAFNSEEKIQETYENYDVIFVDEAHHLGSDVFGNNLRSLLDLIKETPGKYFIGMTATPVRDTDGVDITTYFNAEVRGLSTLDAIEAGMMPQVEYLVCTANITPEERRHFRQYLDVQNSTELLEDIIRNNTKKRWLVYFTDIRSLDENICTVRNLFPGHRVIKITSDIMHSQDELDRIRDDENIVIVSVDMLLEGIHLPDMQGVLLFRRIHSVTVFMQIFGRITSIGVKEPPLFVDCTDTAYRMLHLLTDATRSCEWANRPNGEPRQVIMTTLKNQKYYNIAELLHKMRDNRVRLTINGTEYLGLKETCRQLGISISAVQHMAERKGVSYEEAIQFYLDGGFYFEYAGVKYANLLDACEKLGVSYKKVCHMHYNHACTKEEALDYYVTGKDKQKFFFDGEWYTNLTDFCNQNGLNASNVQSWRSNHNCTIEEAISHYLKNGTAARMKPLIFRGKEYPSQRACIKALNLPDNYSCIIRQYARRNNLSFEEALEEYQAKREKSKVIINGKTYQSVHAAIKATGVSTFAVQTLIHRDGLSASEAILMAIEKANKPGFIFDGNEYSSLSEACRIHGCLMTTVRSYAKKKGVSDEEALAAQLAKKYFVYDGISYDSLSDCCKKLGVDYKLVIKDIRRKGISRQEAVKNRIEVPNRNKKLCMEMDGTSYPNAKSACKAFGLNYSNVSAWRQRNDASWPDAIRYYIAKNNKVNTITA